MWIWSHERRARNSRSTLWKRSYSSVIMLIQTRDVGFMSQRDPSIPKTFPSVKLPPLVDSSRLTMPFHRTQPLRALVVAASVASIGAPGTIPGINFGGPISLSNAVRHHFHGEQYRQYRRACYRLAFMARSIQETAGVFGALGTPVKLTCGIALTLVQALEVSSEPFACPTSHSLLI